jgi:hypothetical protein
MPRTDRWLRLASMDEELTLNWVEVTFVGSPPGRQVAGALGVFDVAVDGSVLRCLVCGSFQPLLEAMRGYEVIHITSIPTSTGGD